jgi:5-methylthioribose kinase
MTGAYVALTEATVADFLGTVPGLAARLGGDPAGWQVREVGDGNLNLVFVVSGPAGGLVAKQALPYVRMVGESWPLPLTRAYHERIALADQARLAPTRVPALYHHDDGMALTVMELLDPHVILRRELVAGRRYPAMARHLGEFCADALFFSSDLAVPAAEGRARIARYLGNSAMCRITEDLIFDEPYYAAPMNAHSPALDDLVATIRADIPLKVAVQEMKLRFLAAPEALLHGDLHTGSVMVTATDTRVIDPEFAIHGPIGFDVGMVIANLWMAHFAQPGLGGGAGFADWLLAQAETLWRTFATRFAGHMRASAAQDGNEGGALYARTRGDPAFLEAAIAARIAAIWSDMLGFAGCEIIRRILGLAHVADFEAIADPGLRAACEREALHFARDLLVERAGFGDWAALDRRLPRERVAA